MRERHCWANAYGGLPKLTELFDKNTNNDIGQPYEGLKLWETEAYRNMLMDLNNDIDERDMLQIEANWMEEPSDTLILEMLFARPGKKMNGEDLVAHVQGKNSESVKSFMNKEGTLNVVMGEHCLKALVDTGASVSLIHGKVLQFIPPHVKLEVIKPKVNSISFANDNEMNINASVRVGLELGDGVFNAEFLVAPYLAVDMILGMDFLKNLSAIINLDEGSVIFNPSEHDKLGTGESRILSAGRVMSTREIKDPNFEDPTEVIPLSPWNGYYDKNAIPEELTGKKNETLVEIDLSKSALSPQGKQRLLDALEPYKGIFAAATSELRGTNVVECNIKMKPEAKPFISRVYKTSPHQREEIEKQVNEMLQKGIIKSVVSDYSSPVVLVDKKDKTSRMCIDYRKLNEQMMDDSYPLPNLNEQLEMIGMSKPKFMTQLDLRSAFWQIPVGKESQRYLTFTTHMGTFSPLRMPYGIKVATSTFQRAMDRILRGLTGKKVMCYVDDVIVTGENEEDHHNMLMKVIDVFWKHGVSLKPSKCNFGASKIQHLGHVISEDGLEPDPDKIKAVKDYPTPTNVTEVRSFLGLVNYYRKFIKGCSLIARPLQDLTKKDHAFEWTLKCKKAFQILKERLISPPILAFPDVSKPYRLYTDSSNYSVGYVLAQVQNDNSERPIVYGGKSMTSAQKNYTISEKEMLAVIVSLKDLRSYLKGAKFTIITDHSALKHICANRIDLSGRLARWALALQAYDYTIEHRAGKLHGNADALSRRIYDEQEKEDEEVWMPMHPPLPEKPMVAVTTRAQAKRMKVEKNKNIKPSSSETMSTMSRIETLEKSTSMIELKDDLFTDINLSDKIRVKVVHFQQWSDDKGRTIIGVTRTGLLLPGTTQDWITCQLGETGWRFYREEVPRNEEVIGSCFEIETMLGRKKKVCAVKMPTRKITTQADLYKTAESYYEACGQLFDLTELEYISILLPPTGKQVSGMDMVRETFNSLKSFIEDQKYNGDVNINIVTEELTEERQYKELNDKDQIKNEKSKPGQITLEELRELAKEPTVPSRLQEADLRKDLGLRNKEKSKTLAKEQRNDPNLKPIIDHLKSMDDSNSIVKLSHKQKKEVAKYELFDDILYKHVQVGGKGPIHLRDRMLIVVPECLQYDLLKAYHSDQLGGHRGAEKLYLTLKQKYIWKNMATMCHHWVESCDDCMQVGPRNPHCRAPMGLMLAYHAWSIVHLDIIGPLTLSKRSNKYIIICICRCTRYPVALAVQEISSITVARFIFQHVICMYGPMQILVTDQGSNLISEVIKYLCKAADIEKIQSSPYHPQSNGLIERAIRSLKTTLARMCSTHMDDWDDYLDPALYCMRTSPNETVGYSPYQLLYGREVLNPIDYKILPEVPPAAVTVKQYLQGLSAQLDYIHQHARQIEATNLERTKTYYDRNSKMENWIEGDLIWIYSPELAPGSSRKLQKKWVGPFSITKMVGKSNAKVRRLGRPRESNKNYNVTRFKRYINRHIQPPPVNIELVQKPEDNLDEADCLEMDFVPLRKTEKGEETEPSNPTGSAESDDVKIEEKEFQDKVDGHCSEDDHNKDDISGELPNQIKEE